MTSLTIKGLEVRVVGIWPFIPDGPWVYLGVALLALVFIAIFISEDT